ncbi:hypothetical protein DdX_13566 [Ditylenchus destructor]|uniref:Uncharacterized protein n=1 Tax=Ditylenchus destructor TaxID=166010 RepID=A0AAD4MYB7_9BILA|nr:hypothetical protein DdX_13566 [Ditylenchus destructor]
MSKLNVPRLVKFSVFTALVFIARPALGEGAKEHESSIDINSEQNLNGYYEKNATEKKTNEEVSDDEWLKMVENYKTMSPYPSIEQFLKVGQSTKPKILQVQNNFGVTIVLQDLRVIHQHVICVEVRLDFTVLVLQAQTRQYV